MPAARRRGHPARRGQSGASSSPSPTAASIGVGLSFFVEQGAHGTSVLAAWGRPIVPGYEQANVKLTPDGEIEIHVGTHSHGQGHETTYAQVAYEILGVDFDKIKVVQGDTLYTPYSTSTWGSRSMVHGGGAVATASRLLAQRAAHIGAWLMQARRRRGATSPTARSSPATAASRCATWRTPGICSRRRCRLTSTPAASTSPPATAQRATAERSPTPPTPPWWPSIRRPACIEILDYVVVEDGGTLVNPMIVDGQIRGGTAQGIGTCLYEAITVRRARPAARHYACWTISLPGATDVPNIRVLHMQTPSPYTEFGIKGLGEGGAVGPPAAIVSAVNDALRPLGVEVHDLPLTPQRVLAAIESRRPRGSATHTVNPVFSNQLSGFLVRGLTGQTP